MLEGLRTAGVLQNQSTRDVTAEGITSQVIQNTLQPIVGTDSNRPSNISLSTETPTVSITTSDNVGQTIPVTVNVPDIVPDHPRSAQQFNSSSVPLHARVHDKLRNRIWADEYIELAELLKTTPNLDYSLQIMDKEGSPSLCFTKSMKEKSMTLDQWLSAIHIFTAVYTVKKPEQGPNLVKYIEIVRDLAKRGGDWRYYDESFRYMRSSEGWPWEQPHWELWFKAVTVKDLFKSGNTSGSSLPYKPFRYGSRRFQQPLQRGVCLKYNSRRPCSGCRFDHRCGFCRGAHPSTQCSNTSNHGYRLLEIC